MDSVDKQIKNLGGPDLGWDAPDHKDFLRVWTKHGGRQVIAFNNEVQRAVASMEVDQIAEHVERYRTYLELTALKKDLIIRYKESKAKILRGKLAEAEVQN